MKIKSASKCSSELSEALLLQMLKKCTGVNTVYASESGEYEARGELKVSIRASKPD